MSKLQGRERRFEPASVWLALSVTGVALAIGFLIKFQCVLHAWADNFQYRRLCYNDIQPLFGVRGISRGLLPYRDVLVEYPVLTGTFMDLVGRLQRAMVEWGWLENNGDSAYFGLTALFLVPFAGAVTLLLRPRVTRQRLMLWAAGTPIIFYAFHNWDLLAVAAAVWGLVALERQRAGIAGTAWALGASTKLFPAFLVPGAVLARWADGDRSAARRLIGALFAVFLAVNLPWLIVAQGDPSTGGESAADLEGLTLREPGTNGWMEVWVFHADRYPDFGTAWYWIAKYGRAVHPASFWNPGQPGYRDFVSLASLALFVVGSAALLRRGWARRLEPQGYPVAAVGLGILCVFLLTSKVHSPQYALWIVPFLALLNIPWSLALGYLAADLLVFVSGFYYFTVMTQSAPAWQGVFEASVWARVVALAALAWASIRATRLEPVSKGQPPKNAESPAPSTAPPR